MTKAKKPEPLVVGQRVLASFEKSLQQEIDLQTARQKAHAAVDKMTLAQLRAAFGEQITE